MQFSGAIWWRHNKSKMADGRHIENRFLAISRRHIGQTTRNLEQKWRSHADIGHVTKTAIFANSRWRTAAILKIALSPYLRRELSDFDQIWYTDTNFHSEHANLTKKSKFLKFKMADGRHIENRFFLYLGAILADQREIWKRWRITCRCISSDHNCNFRKFKMADGRHFENSFISIFSR